MPFGRNQKTPQHPVSLPTRILSPPSLITIRHEERRTDFKFLIQGHAVRLRAYCSAERGLYCGMLHTCLGEETMHARKQPERANEASVRQCLT